VSRDRNATFWLVILGMIAAGMVLPVLIMGALSALGGAWIAYDRIVARRAARIVEARGPSDAAR
jgi:hypothetical protein